MAARVQHPCLAKPGGEPCVNRCGTSHPYMHELSCCFSCKETVTVTRESARLLTEGVPIRSADRIKTKFQGVCTDYQHPNGSVGGAARETLCAFCTQPAREDDPLFECGGSRNGTACKLVWHSSCLLSTGGTAPPPQGDVFRCCTGWPARAEVDSKDRFDEGFTHYRKGIAKPGSLRSVDAPADAPSPAPAAPAPAPAAPAPAPAPAAVWFCCGV